MLTLPSTDIPTVFPSRNQAEAAVGELVILGLADEHLARGIHSGRSRVLEEDADRSIFRSVTWGIALGLPLGVFVGALIVLVAQLIVGETPTVGSVLGAGLGGSLGGVFFGTVFGVLRREHLLHQADPYEAIDLGPSEVLVVARSRGMETEVAEVLHRYGGRLVTENNWAAAA